MQYLLDTHTLLWFLQDDPQLPKKISSRIRNIENNCFVSIASLWEIAIKIKLGKLSIKFPFERFAVYLADNDLEVLAISFDHISQVLNLDMLHRDPFDRIIIAQGITEDLTILTRDEHFDTLCLYSLKSLFC
ncbi:PIN domain nuclease, a component of toxin-antitoxin system (PIN domain) [Hydrobacter penzbergensis]|uniref:PIN domain nuclease, a component of toxin-antitoxin system (PIN domain) n=1 Tax=Hydrobacter penzbergensis TaxID=1235997 RepID=A0A8X8IFE4_9BACT|nr:type II toxin-antitoxin system VapC family toxin [Hydrobacter penzbergensis]SDW86745.1 PIN domain nuclease, a component of toxin-antitoxin system (PIN domain) [Hydrobacter penzbergensis]